jgi:hypothetical protein
VPDERRTEAEGDAPPTRHEEEEATRYPGHEDPEALRERSGLSGREGREPEVAPEVERDGRDS